MGTEITGKVAEVTIKEKLEYLQSHFRYSTMSGWNRVMSFARNVKLHRIGAPNEAYDFVNEEIAYEDVRQIINDFQANHLDNYTIGFNGRSSGYLVLYKCHYEETGHKSYCRNCGEKNFKEVVGEMGKCGYCGANCRVNVKRPPRHLVIECGKQIGDEVLDYDIKEELDEDQIDTINTMYQLIKDFNECVDECISAFLNFVESHKFVEEEKIVTRKVRVCVEK